MSFMKSTEQKISKIVMNVLRPKFKYAVIWLDYLFENIIVKFPSITTVCYDNLSLSSSKNYLSAY